MDPLRGENSKFAGVWVDNNAFCGWPGVYDKWLSVRTTLDLSRRDFQRRYEPNERSPGVKGVSQLAKYLRVSGKNW